MLFIQKLARTPLFIYLFDFPIILVGFFIFAVTRKTPKISYWSMRRVYAAKGPEMMKTISGLCEKLDFRFKKNEPWKRDSIFQYSDPQVDSIVETIKKDGYCILPFQLPESYIAQLTQLATNAECSIRQASVPGLHKIDLLNPVGPWYSISEKDLISDSNVMRLAHDSLFLDISEKYLGKTPVNDLLALWWSLPFPNADKDDLAQMYHFDLDRLNFIKFFFYLTDVDMNNGPHCFIRGSHRHKNIDLAQDRRYTDDEILKNYGKENEIVMTGRKGMILAEDTRGYHKGLPPIRGHRLLFQLEFASSLFGQDYNAFNIHNEFPEIYERFKKQSTLWQRFL